MTIVVLDGFEGENCLESTLNKLLKEQEKEFSYFKLREMNIQRCSACGACGIKSPGKCVIKDDMQDIFGVIAKADWIIFLTPLRFGGYSSQLKKAIDRFMPLGLPFYFVKNGDLFHISRYGHKFLVGIALEEENLLGQQENFEKLVGRNAANLQYTGKALIFKPSDAQREIKDQIGKALKGGAVNG